MADEKGSADGSGRRGSLGGSSPYVPRLRRRTDGTLPRLSGIGPAEIRAAASEPGFLAGVLEHLIADEALLTAFAAETGFEPTDPAKALAVLGGAQWEREVP